MSTITIGQKNPYSKYPGNRELFDGLAAGESAAIRCLQDKGRGAIFSYGKMRNVGELDLQEVVEDATVLFLEKINKGDYIFQGLAPVTYMVEVGKRLVLKRTEKRQMNTVEVDSIQIGGDDEIDRFYEQKAIEEQLGKVLGQIGENCRLVIHLRYYERFSDAEVIEKKLSPYSTVGSLKVKRSECIAKLSEMMAGKKHLFF
jgi:DNA-directed RNA polymerase specialized sigma24 family protein